MLFNFSGLQGFRALGTVLVLLIGASSSHAQVEAKTPRLEAEVKAGQKIIYVGPDRQPVVVTVQRLTAPPALGRTGGGKGASKIMIDGDGGGCVECYSYGFGGYFDFFSGGGGAIGSGGGGPTVTDYLDLVVVSGQSIGCTVSVDGRSDYACDLSLLPSAPAGIHRLDNMTPFGKADLQDRVAQAIWGRKAPKCVYADAASRAADTKTSPNKPTSYPAADIAARQTLTGITVKTGDIADVQYKDGAIYTFTIIVPSEGLSDGLFHMVTPMLVLTQTPCRGQG